MPTMPAPLAAHAERWFGRSVKVTTVDDLSANLRRITFAGDAMIGRSWRPGHEIEFRVSARDLRHYTPTRFEPTTGTFDVIFCTLAGGPGSVWVNRLRPGSHVAAIGPNPGLRFRPGQRCVVLGDASTIGLFASFGANATRGAIEVPAPDQAAAALLAPELGILPASGSPGSALRSWTAAATIDDQESAYLAGHAETLQRLRALLRDRGVPRSRIVTKAYWASGRTGL